MQSKLEANSFFWNLLRTNNQMEISQTARQNGNLKAASMQASVANADPMEYNVTAIAKLEESALEERSTAERMSDVITKFTGSMGFVLFHVVLFAFWFAVNLNFVPGVAAFDPFPFGILTLIVSTEGVFLAIFILISQNRITRQADRRAHLDLQINILAEQELTMILQLQKRLCERMGVATESVQEEAHRLMEKTDVERLVGELENKIPTA
jgi:uncharacterized membrane protein